MKAIPSTNRIEILTPIAEYLGVPVMARANGTLYFTDKDGHEHDRNIRLSESERSYWIRRDIQWYRSQGWV